MDNYVQVGNTLSLAAPYDRLSGQMALIGTLLAVAATDVLSGATAEWDTVGVFDVAKVGSQAWTVGAKVYWDDTNKYLTTTASGNTLAGCAIVAVGSGAGETTGRVRLNGTV
jgi:predicted RecA/RadA family phage recombinase